MKLSKKILAAFSVAAMLACAGTFVSCSDEDDDDDEGAISRGNSNNFSIDYTNNGSSTYRAYRTTSNNYRGGVAQITMNKSSAGAGAMGIIWDLESADEDGNYSRAVKGARRFFIVGFNYNQTSSGKVAYYCSKYADVTDIQAQNFGAVSTKIGATLKEGTDDGTKKNANETEYIRLSSSNVFDIEDKADGEGNFTITVWVREGKWDTDGIWENSTTTYKPGDYDGTYRVTIFNGAISNDEIETATGGIDYTIPAEDIGYVVTADNTTTITAESKRDKPLAVYANVYQGKKLTGSWKYVKTYQADEIVEE